MFEPAFAYFTAIKGQKMLFLTLFYCKLLKQPPLFAKAKALPRVAPKLEWVNALRGLAILGVILCHTYIYAIPGKGVTGNPWPALPALLQAIAQEGRMGVQLFFIASAFTLFLSGNGSHRTERRPVLNFFLRRFFRIAPIYYLGIAYFGVWHHFVDGYTVTPWEVLANVFFVNAITPELINRVVPGGWSISVEMMFYCLVPLLVRSIRSVSAALWLICGSLFLVYGVKVVLSKLGLFPSTELTNDFLYYFLPNQLAIFGLGMLFYHLYQGTSVDQPGVASVRPGVLLACAAVVVFNNLVGIPNIGFHFFYGVAVVLLALALSKRPYFLFVNPLTTFVGTISFSLYLVHFAVLYAAQQFHWINIIDPSTALRATLNFGLRYAVVLAASSVAAYAMYHLIEVPCQNLGKRFIARLEQ